MLFPMGSDTGDENLLMREGVAAHACCLQSTYQLYLLCQSFIMFDVNDAVFKNLFGSKILYDLDSVYFSKFKSFLLDILN